MVAGQIIQGPAGLEVNLLGNNTVDIEAGGTLQSCLVLAVPVPVRNRNTLGPNCAQHFFMAVCALTVITALALYAFSGNRHPLPFDSVAMSMAPQSGVLHPNTVPLRRPPPCNSNR